MLPEITVLVTNINMPNGINGVYQRYELKFLIHTSSSFSPVDKDLMARADLLLKKLVKPFGDSAGIKAAKITR